MLYYTTRICVIVAKNRDDIIINMTEKYTIEKQEKPLALDVAQVIALEQAIDKAGTSLAELMDRAGRSVAQLIIDLPTPNKKIIIFCGTGNNGGDGWVCAHELASKGWSVSLVTPCAAQDIKAEPARGAALKVMDLLADVDQNLSIFKMDEGDDFRRALSDADVIVDAMLGTGFAGATIRSPYKDWVEKINAEKEKRNEILVLAVDVPSGLSAQTGEAAIPCVKADLTITMIVCKPGLLIDSGKVFCGETLVSKIAEIEPFAKHIEKFRY